MALTQQPFGALKFEGPGYASGRRLQFEAWEKPRINRWVLCEVGSSSAVVRFNGTTALSTRAARFGRCVSEAWIVVAGGLGVLQLWGLGVSF